MPILQNPRHEAFAQARAKGARLDDAYELAGFQPGNGHGARLIQTPEVAERVAEIRALNTELLGANPQSVIISLMRIGTAAEKLDSPAAAREARQALVDACRLAKELASERWRERQAPSRVPEIFK